MGLFKRKKKPELTEANEGLTDLAATKKSSEATAKATSSKSLDRRSRRSDDRRGGKKKAKDAKAQKRQSNFVTAIIVLIGLVGVGLLAYPSFSDWWNSMHQSYAIASYDQAVVEMDTETREELLAAAEKYNKELTKSGMHFMLSDEERARYESLLDVTGNGMMGYIDIPKIDVTLPVYHGTSDAVLQVAIGHIEGSSLPIGGKGTHCCVSGHRGLPSARLFSDLDALTTGDLFTLTVLDRTITYEVDQIRIVLPSDVNDLAIEKGKDYVTLITCTPYGINTHRLLVRGHRTSNAVDAVLADAVQIDPRMIALVLGVPTLLVIVIWIMLITSHHRRRRRSNEETTNAFRSRRSRRQSKVSENPEARESASDDSHEPHAAKGQPTDDQNASNGESTGKEARHEGE